VYGDHPVLPRKEEAIGSPLSPYALTKVTNQQYAHIFAKTYGLNFIGFRYFNIFGDRQNSEGAYAAVIPRWRSQLLSQQRVTIYGDGNTSRDFCYVGNAIQANLLAATTEDTGALNQVYNIAYGERTRLNDLFDLMISESGVEKVNGKNRKPYTLPFANVR
jgi:UDP-N-acetylglucosamine 4-epimerase